MREPPAPLAAGRRAPAFSVTLGDGRRAALSDYTGRPLLLIFLRHLA